MEGLSGQGVVVSGGTSGIGLATVDRLLAEGCRVFVTGHEEAALKAVLAERDSDQLDGAVCDVRDLDQINAAVAAAESFTGGLSRLANNAGISWREPFLEVTAASWDAIVAVNLRGMFLMAQAVARLLVDAERPGAIVNMASTNAFGGEEDYAHYNASKGGVLQLTRTMAVELGAREIRVNALCPGYIETPLNASISAELDPDFTDRYVRERIPLGRTGTPAEVAAAYAFLLSDDAAFVHGAALVIDGGQLAVM